MPFRMPMQPKTYAQNPIVPRPTFVQSTCCSGGGHAATEKNRAAMTLPRTIGTAKNGVRSTGWESSSPITNRAITGQTAKSQNLGMMRFQRASPTLIHLSKPSSPRVALLMASAIQGVAALNVIGSHCLPAKIVQPARKIPPSPKSRDWPLLVAVHCRKLFTLLRVTASIPRDLLQTAISAMGRNQTQG